MQKSEIELEIRELEYKLSELKQTVTYTENEVKNLDVYTHTKEKTKGSKEEIKRVEDRIAALKEKLEQINEYESTKSELIDSARKNNEERKKQEIKEKEEQKAKDKANEDIRLQKFKKIKQAYKKQGAWIRITNRINGKTPNWKKIKGLYTREQLEYLLNVSNGQTEERKAAFNKANEKRQEKPTSKKENYRKFKKRQMQYNLIKMTSYLNGKSSLDYDMEMESKGRTL